jgi:hypothetical protein
MDSTVIMNARLFIHGNPIVKRLLLLLTAVALLSLEAPGITATNNGLQFNGTNQYVTFGAAPGLGAATFTIETWFKRTAAGAGTSTGSGGIASAIPLVTKGRAEGEGSSIDMNYFMGIDATSAKLVADFEEGPGTGGTLGLNHPITGNTAITSNVWHHAAATYDGQTWRLYLDGVQDGTLTLSVARPPRSDSIQHAALATAMTSAGAAAGFFAGVLDEARIWNVARTAAQILASRDAEITSASGLIGRWGMNEGTGTSVGDSSGSGIGGNAVGSPSWVAGFPIPDTTPPAAPQNLTATAGTTLVTLTWTANTETDIAGYNVYRSLTSPVPTTGTPVNGATLITASTFSDNGLTNFTTYFYAIRAVDTSANASSPSNEASAAPDPAAGAGLHFDGVNDLVTFGPAQTTLGTATFTIETWFKRDGPGVATSTGTGGVTDAIPLVTKGRAEAEGSNVDMNYFLGIQASTNKLAADFEDLATGANHPVIGTTTITSNVWHHAAATYNGTKWQLFLDGGLEADVAVNQTPRSDSIQHAGLGSALNSTGVAAGFFQGTLDEARIWNFARTQSQIQGTMTQQVSSGAGLLGRWSMNEASGTTLPDSTIGGTNGTLVNGTVWAAGYPFSGITNQPPVVDAGSDLTITLPSGVTLLGTVTDDGLPSPPGQVTTLWSKVSGPGTVTFGNANSPGTDATFSTDGVYVLRLTGSDSLAATSDEATITVNPASVNQPPAVDAGPDQTITLSAGASLAGTVTDDGIPGSGVTSTWSKLSGPGTVTFADTHATTTTAAFSAVGGYVLRLTASDGALSGSDDIGITVTDPVLVGAGDIAGDCVNGGSAANAELTAQLLDGIPGAVFTLGDNAYQDGTLQQFNSCYGPTWGRHKARTRPVTGNHDYNVSASAAGYFDYFNGVGNQTGPAGDRPDAYYSYNLGAWHIVVLNSECTSLWNPNGCDAGSAQEQWLRADLAASATNNIIAMWHRPRFSSTSAAATHAYEQPLWQALYDHGTDIILGGHWHNYERLAPTDPNGQRDDAYGLRQFVVGTGGVNHSAFGTVIPTSEIREANTYGVLKLTLHAASYDWEFVPVAGATFTDSGTAAVHGPPPVPTVTSINPNVGAAAGGTVVTVSGANFGTGAGATSIRFAATAATNVSCATTSTCTATSPAGTGTVHVTATVAGVTSAIGAGDQFTYDQPPVVNAGSDASVTLPAAASLTGTVTDDGVPNPPGTVTTTWSKFSGPGTVTFGNSGATSTTASFGAAGTYVLRLTANDGLLASSDDVTITVSAANQAPVVNAGSDQTITLPADASLSGTVTDDGQPGPTVTSTWTKVSGPGTVTFANANATTTTASFSAAGVYVLRLTATDTVLAGSDDVTITVNPEAGNYAIDFGGTNAYVTFGAAPALGLPAFTIEAKFRRDGTGVITSTGTGGITSGLPIVTKGRAESENSSVDMNYFLGIDTATGTLAADFEEANTGLAGNNPGLNHPVRGVTPIQNGVWYHAAATYDGTTWRLFLNGALETQLTVGQPPRSDSIQHAGIGSALNSTGVAAGFFDGVIDEVRVWDHARTSTEIRAGVNQEISSASGLVARWGLDEGIGTAVDNSTPTAANGSIAGSNWGWTAGAPPINVSPVVDAGVDQAITLPANASLNGAVTDDGLPNPPAAVTVSWSKVSGPGTVTFTSANAISTDASFSAAGTYVLRLTANDSAAAASDDVTIIVNAQVNQAPVVNAGDDQTITLPADALLSGTVNDDGLPGPTVTNTWTKVSGPGTVAFANANATSTTASFSTAGSYVLRLTANDGVLTGSDEVSITVNPVTGNYAIDFGGTNAYVTFGPAPAIGLPAFTIEAKFRRDGAGVGTNTGTGGFASALPLVTKGRAQSENSNVDMNYFLGIDTATGTLAADFEEANTGLAGNTPGLNHPVSGVTQLQNGIWYHAAATYDGTTWRLFLNGVLETQLTVGQPPRSDSIQHAAIGSALNSTGVTDGFFDGVIDEVRVWDHARTQSEIRADLNLELSSGTGLVARWGLNEGIGTSIADSTADSVTGSIAGSNWSWVTGAPAVNLAPTVDAGTDQTIALPADAALSGTVADDGLPNPPAAVTTTWSKVSGPGTVTFADGSHVSTTATFTAAGTYVLSLTANDGAAAVSDQITITATGNQAPVVSAGPDQNITLPAEALLNGSATDDGLPAPPTLTIGWTKVSGPGVVTFAEITSPITTVSFSVAGVYVLRLTAGDTALTTSDDVTITVNPTGSASNQAIDFGGTNAYVTFGNPAKLHLSTFTVETWFNRQGTGVSTNTGSSGIATALPLVTRGMAETETAATDLNYFLGIDTSTNVLAADFEEGAGGTSPSLNHPVTGVTPITTNTWHHAAATYDGSKWQLFLDGVLERELTVGQPPAAAGNQHAAIGTALNSTGGVGSQTQGFFDGVIDEARIWNRALTASEIRDNANVEIISANGLVARWGLNEGAGTSVGDSTSSPAVGTIVGSSWNWAAGAPFNLNHAPNAPVLIAPANGGTDVPTSPSLGVSVADADGGNLTVTYYGRSKSTTTSGPDFTLIALPDTQFYVSSLNGGTPAIFDAQTQWIVNNKSARNIVFVTQLGDCVQNGDNGGNPIEWTHADNAMSRLEDPLTTFLAQGLPFGIAVGNHDQSPTGDPNGTTTFYNQYFGASRFTGRNYYGGHYGSNNDNHYELFSQSGLDFIVVHFEYDPAANPAVLAWANGLLQTYSDRRAIVVSHFIINAGNPGTFGAQGQAIYNALKGNPNLFLMLSGHVSPPEGQRQDTFNGHTVTTLMSDYQSRTNGGNGWLRIMEFSPANNQIRVQTYSPTLNQFETDADSQFTLNYDMQGTTTAFEVIGTNANVPSGSSTSATWANLAANTAYEWYVTVSDGVTTTTGPTWSFTTTHPNQAPVANTSSTTTLEDTAKAITLTASDPENDPLTYAIVGQPAHGTLSGAAPNVTYTPAVNYNGPDSFTFRANDGAADSNTATVSVTVTPVNDAPVANAQSVTTAEDTARAITLTASDVDGGTLSYSIVSGPAHGTVSGTAPNVTYTPAANYNGPDSLTFSVNDGTVNSNTATVSMTVTAVNDTPVASNGSYTTPRNRSVSGTLTASDIDSSPLTYAIVTQPRKGSVTITNTATGAFIYVPAGNGSDTFSFRANDGILDSNTATVSIQITAAVANTAPVASNGAVSAIEDTASAGTLTATDADGNPLTYRIITNGTKGTVTVTNASTGAFTYAPGANLNGADSFTFRANDGTVDSNLATVSVTIAAVNDPPVANADTTTIPFNTAVAIAVLANDVDPDQDALSVASVTQAPAHGTAAITGTTITYTPASGYTGADGFKYIARDPSSANSNEATVTVTVAGANQPPVAQDQSVTTAEDVQKAIVLSGSDPDGSPVTFAVVTPPAHGTLSGVAPNVTYSPALNYNGADSFTFRVNDGSIDSNSATVSITVTAVNDAPVAGNGALTVAPGTPTPGTLSATDVDGNTLTFTLVTQPKKGTISGFNSQTGQFIYTSKSGAKGSDSFTFSVSDGFVVSNVAKVTVTIR